MSTRGHGKNAGETEVTIDDTSLIVAAANDLSSPLILLRQLGLALGSDTISREEQLQISKRLTLTSERALRMAAGLSLTSAGQQQFELEPLNPVSVCQDVIHELLPLYTAHGQTIDMPKRSRVPLLVGNRQLLRQILLGYIDNALYYGSLSHPVRVSITTHQDTVRIGVRDYGPALPTDIWQQVERRVIRRSSKPVASRPHISTISLVAAKRLAETMGSAVGTIRHRDGATFYVDMRVSGQTSLL